MASGVLRVTLDQDNQPIEDLGIFDFNKMSISEAIQLNARTRLTPKTFIENLGEMDPEALQALVWLLRVRKGGIVSDPHTITFNLGDLKIEEEPDFTETSTDAQTPSGNAAAATSDSSLMSAA